MIDSIYLWDCICDACDPSGRYHKIGTHEERPGRENPGPRWLLILLCLAISIGLAMYLRGIGS